MLNKYLKYISIPIWPILIVLPIMLFGLFSMSDVSGQDKEFYKQAIWIIISICSILIFSNINYRNFLTKGNE